MRRGRPQLLGTLRARRAASWADRFRLADTVGVWNPFQTHAAILSLRTAEPNLAIGFHGHNDLGMATANTLAAVQAGAASVDVTVNGLGERAGNAALEEVVMALRVTLEKPCGIDTTRFVELSTFVAGASGRPLPPAKPITGAAAFRHESGIHVRGLAGRSPNLRAVRRRDGWKAWFGDRPGKHSGTAAIRHVLADEGISVTAEEAAGLLAKIRETACQAKTFVRLSLYQLLDKER